MGAATRDRLNYNGPTLEDCQRIWDTLTFEYITDLEIRLDFPEKINPTFRPRLVLWSPGLDSETGGPRPHTWATKELQPGFEAITYRQLYDLLIVGYRSIDGHFGGQQPIPLP